MTDMGPRTYWTPGTVLPEEYTDQLRESPTALKHHHIVTRAFFTGQGHAGVLISQYNAQEWAVWQVDVYGNPSLFSFNTDVDLMREVYRERVGEHLNG